MNGNDSLFLHAIFSIPTCMDKDRTTSDHRMILSKTNSQFRVPVLQGINSAIQLQWIAKLGDKFGKTFLIDRDLAAR